MNEQKITVVMPEYMRKFKCIAGDCEESCCLAGWNIYVDERTYRRYMDCSDVELKEVFQRSIQRTNSNTTVGRYGRIVFQDGRCPFLTTKGLCGIQTKLGESYLSKTCVHFPKMSNVVGCNIEKSASMACPEAARLALLNPHGMDFVSSAGDPNDLAELKGNRSRIDDSVSEVFLEVRGFAIRLLTSRQYELWERLVILGLFCEQATECAKEGNVGSMLSLVNGYVDEIFEGRFGADLKRIPSRTTVQMMILREITEFRLVLGVNSQTFLRCVNECMKGIGCNDPQCSNEDVRRLYKEAHEKYYEPFMKRHEYILENYLVNYTFSRLFPFSKANIYENYMEMVLHYGLIKMYLTGMAAFHKSGFNTDIVIRLISSFFGTVVHKKQFLDKVRELLEKTDRSSRAYMTLLIRD